MLDLAGWVACAVSRGARGKLGVRGYFLTYPVITSQPSLWGYWDLHQWMCWPTFEQHLSSGVRDRIWSAVPQPILPSRTWSTSQSALLPCKNATFRAPFHPLTTHSHRHPLPAYLYCRKITQKASAHPCACPAITKGRASVLYGMFPTLLLQCREHAQAQRELWIGLLDTVCK